jgi:tryptophan-rich sensory protein
MLDHVAGLLLVPYLAWVAYATLLNGTIWQLNG